MSNSDNQQHQVGGVHVVTRKKRRGMIEKRRRDKINNSLTELRRLVPAAFEKQGSAKLEKAEILQMTVDYLRMLHARGLADSLTHNKELVSPPCEPGSNLGELVCSPQEAVHRQTILPSLSQANSYHQAATIDNNPQQAFIKQPQNRLSHQHNPHQQHQQQQQQHQPLGCIDSSPTLGASSSDSPSINSASSILGQQADIQSRNLYTQHHHMLVEQAAYHHHLSASEMVGMVGSQHTSAHSSANNYANLAQHQQHQASIIKHHPIKLDNSHCHPASVIGQSHSHSASSLLNLDNQHHHHHHSQVQVHAHHHHHPLSMRYGHAASMSPYLAAYPTIPSNIAGHHQASSNPHSGSSNFIPAPPIETLQNSSIDERNGSYNNLAASSQESHTSSQPQLTQLDSRSPSAGNGPNDSNSHQQVSSSSSPSHSTSESSGSTSISASSQRHYRPWGTGLAY